MPVGTRDGDFAFPPRVSLFGRPAGWAWRCPSLLFMAALVPLMAGGLLTFILGSVRLFYGMKDALPGDVFLVMAALMLPGAAMLLMYLAGRLELVDALPGPREERRAAGHLALPGADEDLGMMRAPDAALPAVRPAWSAAGVLLWSGGSLLGLALAVSFLATDGFDSVLGVKLGGSRFQGSYWSNWELLCLAAGAAGLVLAAWGVAAYTARLNRREG